MENNDYTPQKLDINHNIHDLSYLDDENYQFIEIPKGYWLNCGRLLDINPERDHDIETLGSSSAAAIKTKHLPTSEMPGTPDNLESWSDTHASRDENANRKTGVFTPDTPGENALSRDSMSNNPVKLTERANKAEAVREGGSTPPADISQSSITDDQPKAICNLSSQSTHAPSAASSNNMEYCLNYNEVIDDDVIDSCDEPDKNIGCCFCPFFEFAELDDCGDE